MKINKTIFASKNKGKIREVKKIFADMDFKIISLLELDDKMEIDETGTTFEENSKIKAFEVFNRFKIPTIADDSGISVDQLGGRPGVYSARYSGENATDDENNDKLIEELKDFEEPHLARYVCAAVFYDGKNYLVTEDTAKGKIVKTPRGKNGFGYDPYFVPEGYDCTMGELSLEEKNKISHRAKAFNKLRDKIKKYKMA
jgi:XTP/dITP diphosphohydrolase